MNSHDSNAARAALEVQPTWAERALAKLAPDLAAKRLSARRKWAYEAARSTRLRGRETSIGSVNTSAMQRDRIQLMRDARDLEENHGLIASIQNRLGLYAFGRLTYHALTGNDDLNRKVNDLVWEWMQDVCDGPRTTLAEYGRLALRSMLRDGDMITDAPISDGPFKLRAYESDLIGGVIPMAIEGEEESEVNGVIYRNSDGMPLSYVPYRRTLGNHYVRQEPVPASRMLVLMAPYRFFQYRGFSAYGPVINVARDLKEIEEACRIGVKVENFGAGWVTTPNGQHVGDPTALLSESAETGPRTSETIEPGQMKYLPSGSTVNMVKSERPTGNFQTYLELLTRQLGLCLQMPPGFLYSLAGMGGPAVRMDAQQAQRAIDFWRDLVANYLLNPAKNRFLLWCVSKGKIQPEEFEGFDLFAGRWGYSSALTIDAGREENAAREAIKMGLLSEADYFDEAGKDYREEKAIIAAEAREKLETAKALAKETGVSVSRAMDLLGIRTGQQTPEIVVSDNEAQGQPLGAKIGVGGVQGYIQLLTAAGSGAMPTAMARESLVELFGISPDRASTIIPDAAPSMELPRAGLSYKAELQEESHEPTAAMADNAKRALEVREAKPESQRGMTAIGLARARDISNRRPLSLETVRRMKAYFDRHEIDKQGETWDEQGKGWQAWNGWGGDEGRTWANAIVERANKEEE
jgi:capsid protein